MNVPDKYFIGTLTFLKKQVGDNIKNYGYCNTISNYHIFSLIDKSVDLHHKKRYIFKEKSIDLTHKKRYIFDWLIKQSILTYSAYDDYFNTSLKKLDIQLRKYKIKYIL